MDFRTKFGNHAPKLRICTQLYNDFYRIVKLNMKHLFYLWMLLRIAGLWLFISSLWAANIDQEGIDWFSSIEMHDAIPNRRKFTSLSKVKRHDNTWTLVHMNAQYLRVPNRHPNSIISPHLHNYYGNWMTPYAAEKHAETLGSYLGPLKADFIHLCEVHNRRSVEEILKHFDDPEEYNIFMINSTESYKRWHYSKQELGLSFPPPIEDGPQHNMACAFITKFDLVSPLVSFTKVHQHKGKYLNLGRNLGGYFHVPGYADPVFICGLHLPRQLPLQTCHGEFLLQRLKEFTQKYSHSAKNKIFLGDFNSGDSDLGVGTPKQTMSGMVERFKSEFGDSSDMPLQSAMQFLPHKPFTHKVGIIDHILLSTNVKKHFHSINVPAIDKQKDLSDHAAMIVKFNKYHPRRTKPRKFTRISRQKHLKTSFLSSSTTYKTFSFLCKFFKK